MCIGSNSVNQAQDLISVTKFEDFPNSLLPIAYQYYVLNQDTSVMLNDYSSILLTLLLFRCGEVVRYYVQVTGLES